MCKIGHKGTEKKWYMQEKKYFLLDFLLDFKLDFWAEGEISPKNIVQKDFEKIFGLDFFRPYLDFLSVALPPVNHGFCITYDTQNIHRTYIEHKQNQNWIKT